jgi:hypothetical protein
MAVMAEMLEMAEKLPAVQALAAAPQAVLLTPRAMLSSLIMSILLRILQLEEAALVAALLVALAVTAALAVMPAQVIMASRQRLPLAL